MTAPVQEKRHHFNVMAFFDGLLRKSVFLSEVKEKTFSKMVLYNGGL